MGVIDRYRKQQKAEQNKGKPLGGGLDEKPAPGWGAASLAELAIEKPVEQGGKRGMRVSFKVRAQKLPRVKLVLETTLHEQGGGQLKSPLPTFADALGALNVWEVWSPESEADEAQRAVFIPFAAIEVERAGVIKCLARVRVLEADRGCLAQEEAAFAIEAG